MVRRAIFPTVLVVALFVSLAAVAEGPLTGSMQVHKVVLNDSGQETFVAADEVKPSDVIEYRLTYANTGEEPIRNVSITDPIPAGTEYLEKTATRPQSGAVTFSIDNGKSYHGWPIMFKKTNADGTEVEVEATPDMVTHIRWTIMGDFDPNTEFTFSYRTQVK